MKVATSEDACSAWTADWSSHKRTEEGKEFVRIQQGKECNFENPKPIELNLQLKLSQKH